MCVVKVTEELRDPFGDSLFDLRVFSFVNSAVKNSSIALLVPPIYNDVRSQAQLDEDAVHRNSRKNKRPAWAVYKLSGDIMRGLD